MIYVGIEAHSGLIFEGHERSSLRLSPQPLISIATIIRSSADIRAIPVNENISTAPYLFREEFFEPVTRIRRGKLYLRNEGGQPRQWCLVSGVPPPHKIDVHTFQPAVWRGVAGDAKPGRTQLALGVQDAFSLWDVTLAERVVGRTDLLTLRARSTFGLLPEVEELAIPADSIQKVRKGIQGAVDAAHRHMADATIDACRHAAVAALAAWTKGGLEAEVEKLDLGKLLDSIANHSEGKRYSVVINAGKIIARLHVRTKPNAFASHGSRDNEDADGETAISVLGILLRELRQPFPGRE